MRKKRIQTSFKYGVISEVTKLIMNKITENNAIIKELLRKNDYSNFDISELAVVVLEI